MFCEHAPRMWDARLGWGRGGSGRAVRVDIWAVTLFRPRHVPVVGGKRERGCGGQRR